MIRNIDRYLAGSISAESFLDDTSAQGELSDRVEGILSAYYDGCLLATEAAEQIISEVIQPSEHDMKVAGAMLDAFTAPYVH